MPLHGVERFLADRRAGGACYREYPAPPDLADVIACGWIRVTPRGDQNVSLPVIPDGCADIITCNEGPPILVGPDTQARLLSFPDDLILTGIRFRPGALRSIVGLPAHELVDSSAGLDSLVGSAVRLAGELGGASSLRSRLTLLEGWVRGQMRVNRRDRAVLHASRILACQPSTDMTGIAIALGWSVRTLHREFVATCGYGPKMLHRILRVQRTVRSIRRSTSSLSLATAAARLGFADQAHMTREFQAVTGATPAQYLRLSEPGLSRWLDADWPA